MSKTTSERLMYVQLTSCVQGKNIVWENVCSESTIKTLEKIPAAGADPFYILLIEWRCQITWEGKLLMNHRVYRENSRHQSCVRELDNHAGFGNVVEFIYFAV